MEVYHLNLKPEHIAHNIIFVGDQNRVEKITQFFDSIEFHQKKRIQNPNGTVQRQENDVISGIALTILIS
jgi:uridine phosphorylase